MQPGCLTREPPVLVAPALKDCPPGLVVCLDLAGAKQLNADLAALRLWTEEAWLRCGPVR